MFSTGFLNDSAVGSGIPRGGARGGAVPPSHEEIFETRIPTNAISWHLRWLLCIYQTATFVQIFPRFGMGGRQISYLQTNGFFHLTPKGKLNKMCYY